MFRIIALSAVALSLAACTDAPKGRCKAPDAARTDAAADKTVPPAPPPLRQGDEGYDRELARTAVDEAKQCVQRYAWKLHRSEEKTETIAQAAVTACDAFVAAATQAEESAYGTRDLNAAHAANMDAMNRWATLYVVQYRAGVCD